MHYMEREARRLEARNHAELLGDGVPGVVSEPLGWLLRPEPRAPIAERSTCHGPLRAVRYANDVADLRDHPEVFRCPRCKQLLDGPEWVSVNDGARPKESLAGSGRARNGA